MNYKLAKELKDNGFSQEKDIGGQFICSHNQPCILCPNGCREHDEVALIPSLSELIDACGEEVFITNMKGYLKSKEVTEEWLAIKGYGIKKPEDITQGKTPEEAVARLWLALNKK